MCSSPPASGPRRGCWPRCGTPAWCRCYDVGLGRRSNDGSQVDYLVMEYVEGEPSVRPGARGGAAGILGLPPCRWLAQSADALHTAHSRRHLAHRDVKPGNLLVKADGRAVLVDFGIALVLATWPGFTAANMVLGHRPRTCPPSRPPGSQSPAATYIYALGAVAYFCLAGQPPFHGDNPLAVALRHAQEDPAALPADTPPAGSPSLRRPARWPSVRRTGSAARPSWPLPPPMPATRPWRGFPVSARPPWALAAPIPVALAASWPLPPAPSGRPGAARAAGRGDAVRRAGAGGARRAAPTGECRGRPDDRAEADPEDALGRRPAGRRRALLVGAGAVVLARGGSRGGRGGTAARQPEPRRGGPAARAGRRVGGGRRRSRCLPEKRPPAGPGPAATPGASRSASADTDRVPRRRDDQQRPGPAPAAPGGTPTGTASSRPTPSRTPSSRPNPYTAAQACGSGYQVIDSATLTGGDGQRKGRVFLLYHVGHRHQLRGHPQGQRGRRAKSAASAYLEVQGRARSTDSGSFDYYAGTGACHRRRDVRQVGRLHRRGQLRQRVRALRLNDGPAGTATLGGLKVRACP